MDSTEAQRRVIFFLTRRPSRNAVAMDLPRRVGLSEKDEDEMLKVMKGNESESRERSLRKRAPDEEVFEKSGKRKM